MTRTEKIERIRKYRPHIYMQLNTDVPHLVSDPDSATREEILLYNQLIAEEAKRDGNNMAFKKRFSF